MKTVFISGQLYQPTFMTRALNNFGICEREQPGAVGLKEAREWGLTPLSKLYTRSGGGDPVWQTKTFHNHQHVCARILSVLA